MAIRPSRTNKRTPIGTRSVLRAEQREGYVRRFVNDEPGRIKMFEEAGYQIVTDGSAPSDRNVGDSLGTGSVVSKHVGGGTRAVLMEIPVEFYEEDMKAKEDLVKAKEAMMLNNEDGKMPDGIYGKGVAVKHTGRPQISTT